MWPEPMGLSMGGGGDSKSKKQINIQSEEL